MATAPGFDLIDIAHALNRKRNLIIIITVLCGIVAAVFYLVSKKDYEAKTEFFVSNPLYADRNNLFRTHESRFVDYFTNEDDMDKVIAIANSEILRVKVVGREDLFTAYNLDSSKQNDKARMAVVFRKKYEVKRTENQNMEITYTDTDPQLAANVANEAVKVAEEIYSGYFNDIRMNIYKAISEKARESDSTIAVMTDTLARLRDHYGIYDIISPSRAGSTSLKSNGSASFGRGVEEIQNIESLKDQLVADRATYLSLMNEFSTGTKLNEMPLIHVITPAGPPIEHKGLGFILTTIGGILLGLFFAVISVLISAYYRKLISVERNY
jgi:uncharacterized protein involved in exopolysaccharide biosynthesis